MFWRSSALHDGTRQRLSFSIDSVAARDSVGVRVSENGDFECYVNGQNKGVVFQDLPQHQDLWGVVDLRRDIKIHSEFHFGEWLFYVGRTLHTLIN